MDEQNIDYHLQQAITHLDSALYQTKVYFQENQETEEVQEKWNDFLGWMFGNVTETNEKPLIHDSQSLD